MFIVKNQIRMKNFFLILALLLLILTAFGQIPGENEKSTIRLIDKYLSELEKVGLHASVLVDLNGKIIVSNGYGFNNMELQIKNSPSTIYDIGSITKQFTAA